MSTLAEIEDALPKLTPAELAALRQKLDAMAPNEHKQGHSVLDIPTLSVGKILKPLTSDDDILGEMIERDATLDEMLVRTAHFRIGPKPTRAEMNER